MKRQTKLEIAFVAVCLAIASMILWRFYDWMA
jgi:hypothetical protein